MRRGVLVISVVVGLLSGLMALPAAAVQPVEFEAGVTFPDVNPCSGEPHDVTLSWDVALRDNNGATVLTFDTTVTTNDGWSGFGRETEVVNKNRQINSLSIRVGDGNGSFYMVKGQRRIDVSTGDVTVESLRVDCVRS